jgi:hypothetical protein
VLGPNRCKLQPNCPHFGRDMAVPLALGAALPQGVGPMPCSPRMPFLFGPLLLLMACSASRAEPAPGHQVTAPPTATQSREPIPVQKLSAAPSGPQNSIDGQAPDAPPELSADALAALRTSANRALRARDFARAASLLNEACGGGELPSCVQLAELYDHGKGVAEDADRARELYARGCGGGLQQACDRLGH